MGSEKASRVVGPPVTEQTRALAFLCSQCSGNRQSAVAGVADGGSRAPPILRGQQVPGDPVPGSGPGEACPAFPGTRGPGSAAPQTPRWWGSPAPRAQSPFPRAGRQRKSGVASVVLVRSKHSRLNASVREHSTWTFNFFSS